MKKYINKSVVLFFVLVFSAINITAQILPSPKVLGNKFVNVGDVNTYTASPPPGVFVFAANWSVTGGTIQSQNNNSATIQWTSAGSQQITYTITSSSSGMMSTIYGVNVAGVVGPNVPSNPIIVSQNCTSATIQKTGSTPSGVTWYWQGTNSNGTSTIQSATSNYSATASGNYYIRARNSNGVWSNGSGSVVVSLDSNGTIWYSDNDGDGLGDSNNSILSCNQPIGYVSNSSDQCPSMHGGGSANGCSSTFELGNENYVYTVVAQKATTDIELLRLTERDSVIENIAYFDGLGRAQQSIAIRQSVNNKDIVTHIDYDEFGRQAKEYLPFVDNFGNGLMKSNPLTSISNFYNTSKYQNTINPYSEKVFDDSPLNKVVEQTAPGNDWKKGNSNVTAKNYSNGHTIKFENDTNSDIEVRKYYVTTTYANNTYTPTLNLNTNQNNYSKKELYKTITKDENWVDGDGLDHTTEEFKNKAGQVILKRTYNNQIAHDTYYVYDDYGNLTYVLPPKMEASTNNLSTLNSQMNALGYQYVYDNRNRLVQKRIPGKDWEYIIYDQLDRPVLTQDANLRPNKKWLFTKYDQFGRVIYTGLFTHSSIISRQNLQTYFDAQNNNSNELYETKLTSAGSLGVYYSNNNYPSFGIDVLTINYYDNYNFDRAGSSFPNTIGSAYEALTDKVKGLATGSKVKVLETSSWITTVSYYNIEGQPIYTYSKNSYLNTTDIVSSKLDFVGKVKETKTSHTNMNDSSLGTQTTIDYFEYDRVGRLKLQKQKINTNTNLEVIVQNTYDELGQLVSKGVGGKTTQSRLQTVDYKYNIRGWLTNINQDTNNSDNDLFNFTIKYNDITDVNKKLYNGNISQTSWNTLSTDSSVKTYTYNYDALNRITGAVSDVSHYNLNNVSYDKNGNILNLQRQGHTNTNATTFGVMDNLTYSYDNGNKLTKVKDIGNTTFGFKDGADITTEYTYDVNGNMKTDANKGITGITYNHLNLPTQVAMAAGTINYVYDATGVKQKKIVSTGTTTEYAGNYVYKNNNLEFFNHPEGYVQNNNGNFSYVYQYKDHLGNVRLSYSDNNNDGVITASTDPNTNEIIEEKNYYPFGMLQKGYNNFVSSNGNSTAQKYGFNGKELQDELGLEWYDVSARNYDPALGRWMNLDPLAEKGRRHSPYNFAFDNPIRFVDYDGMWPKWGDILDVAQGALDVVGMIPAVGNIADVANAGISLARGDLKGAALNLAAAVPGAGLAVGAAKITKTIVKAVKNSKKVKATLKTVNGNSKASTKAQHVYEVFDTATGDVVKTGISGGKITKKAGKSSRATGQVNKWNKAEGAGKYDSRIVKQIPAGKGARQKALNAEKANAKKLIKKGQLKDPKKHVTPRN
jgi:RHS repeat-associated protein